MGIQTPMIRLHPLKEPGLRLSFPVGNENKKGIRNLVESAEFEQALRELAAPAVKGGGMWSAREKKHQESLKTGDVGRILGTLHEILSKHRLPKYMGYKFGNDIPKDVAVSFSERTIIKSALDILACELSLVTGQPEKKLRDIILSCILVPKYAASLELGESKPVSHMSESDFQAFTGLTVAEAQKGLSGLSMKVSAPVVRLKPEPVAGQGRLYPSRLYKRAVEEREGGKKAVEAGENKRGVKAPKKRLPASVPVRDPESVKRLQDVRPENREVYDRELAHMPPKGIVKSVFFAAAKYLEPMMFEVYSKTAIRTQARQSFEAVAQEMQIPVESVIAIRNDAAAVVREKIDAGKWPQQYKMLEPYVQKVRQRAQRASDEVVALSAEIVEGRLILSIPLESIPEAEKALSIVVRNLVDGGGLDVQAKAPRRGLWSTLVPIKRDEPKP